MTSAGVTRLSLLLAVLAFGCLGEEDSQLDAVEAPPPLPAALNEPNVSVPAPSPPAVSPVAERRGLELVDELKVNEALWGVDVPNAIKGITVAYHEGRDTIYTTGIIASHVVETPLEVGHPTRSVDLQANNPSLPLLLVDQQRDRLFFADTRSGQLRMVNLSTFTLGAQARSAKPKARGNEVAKPDRPSRADRPPRGQRGKRPLADRPPRSEKGVKTRRAGASGRSGRRDKIPIKGLALDPDTGTLYVANGSTGSVTAYDGATLLPIQVFDNARTPMDMQWDAVNKRLLVLDLESNTSASLLAYTPALGTWQTLQRFGVGDNGRPPRRVSTVGGAVVLQHGKIVGLGVEGEVAWSAQPDSEVAALLALPEGRVAVLCRDGSAVGEAEGARSSVLIYNAVGERLARVLVGFEAQRLALDARRNRLLIGNGGDGSVSILDLTTYQLVREVDVANAAEHIRVDPQTGRRFILNRLGGSEIYVWHPEVPGLVRLQAGPWPVDMEIDLEKRTLWVLSHYGAKLHPIDLDTLTVGAPLDLGVPGSRTDALADFDLDPETGWAAAAFSEIQTVVVVDTRAKRVFPGWRPSGLSVDQRSGQPGRLQVAVDGEEVLAVAPLEGKIWRYDAKAVQEKVTATVSGGFVEKGSYVVDLLTIDRYRQRLYAGATSLDLDTLQVVGKLEAVDRVVFAGRDLLVGEDAAGKAERLVLLDPQTGTATATYLLFETSIRAGVDIDPERGLLYTAELARARVRVYTFPVSTPVSTN